MPYVQPHKGKLRFRRKVPRHLASVIGRDVIVAQLGTADPKEADRRVVDHIKRTDEMFRLAEAGEWPPRSRQEIEVIAQDWWIAARQSLPVADPLAGRRAGGFYDEAELVASLTEYLNTQGIGVAVTSPTFGLIKTEAIHEHHSEVGAYTRHLLRLDQNTKKAEYDLRRGKEPVPVATAAPVAVRLATQTTSDLMPEAKQPISFHDAGDF